MKAHLLIVFNLGLFDWIYISNDKIWPSYLDFTVLNIVYEFSLDNGALTFISIYTALAKN